MSDPATLIKSAQTLLTKRSAGADLKKESLSGIARTLEILEKWYGDRRARPVHDDDPTQFVDKVDWIQGVLDELAQRKREQAISVAVRANVVSGDTQETQDGLLQIAADSGPRTAKAGQEGER